MANRFTRKSNRDYTILKGVVTPAALFVAILLLLHVGLGRVGATTEQERLRAVEEAVMRTAVQCYALEGQYPPNLDYMMEHYGLQVDLDDFVVHYQVFAGNLAPDIFVFAAD